MKPLDFVATFMAGVMLTGATFSALALNEEKSETQWRTCAPAQAGQELVSTSQWPDHTDCFYAKTNGKKMPNRKDTVI